MNITKLDPSTPYKQAFDLIVDAMINHDFEFDVVDGIVEGVTIFDDMFDGVHIEIDDSTFFEVYDNVMKSDAINSDTRYLLNKIESSLH